MLEDRGATVIMVRTKQAVNIANSERARIANEAKADLFVRIHCNGSTNRERRGISTLVPGRNDWTAPIVAPSREAGELIHRALLDRTSAKDDGIVSRSDLSGFNWSEVPTVLLELGYMSNPSEDRKLSNASYQAELALGIAEGIAAHLESK